MALNTFECLLQKIYLNFAKRLKNKTNNNKKVKNMQSKIEIFSR